MNFNAPITEVRPEDLRIELFELNNYNANKITANEYIQILKRTGEILVELGELDPSQLDSFQAIATAYAHFDTKHTKQIIQATGRS